MRLWLKAQASRKLMEVKLMEKILNGDVTFKVVLF